MIHSFSIYFPPVNRRDLFLRIGQSYELGKANFQSYKKPLLSGPSAKIIRPAVSSVKEFSHFRRFWKRFRYWSFPCGIEEAKRFPHRKNFAPVNLSVSAWQRPVGVLFLLREFVLPNHLRGFPLHFFASIVRQWSKIQHPVAASNRKIYRRQKMGFVLIQIAYFFLKLQDVSYFSCFTSINFSKPSWRILHAVVFFL